jgi:hypothetical protein
MKSRCVAGGDPSEELKIVFSHNPDKAKQLLDKVFLFILFLIVKVKVKIELENRIAFSSKTTG